MWIVIITALLAAVGLALILSDAFRVPTYAVAKATHNLGKRQNRKTNPLELWLREVANWLSGKLRLNEYKRLQLEADLKTADIIPMPFVLCSEAMQDRFQANRATRSVKADPKNRRRNLYCPKEVRICAGYTAIY